MRLVFSVLGIFKQVFKHLRKAQYLPVTNKGISAVEGISKSTIGEIQVNPNPRLFKSVKCESILTTLICYNALTGYKEILDLDAVI
ncbi:MAG: hypothetical protein QW775_04885 [Ignisphaera sp.]|uniref:Uncharacterized protein n=1 Tax=Ignisphaera aggregans TaxID=334771 RepID=A0A7C4JK25_9CREN